MIKYIKLSDFLDKTGIFFIKDRYKNFNTYLLYENQFINTKNEVIKSYIIQVPMNNHINKLSIYLNKEKMFKEEYFTDIYINDNIPNYFHIHNARNDITIKINTIFEYYLDYFFFFFINDNIIKLFIIFFIFLIN